MKKLMQLKYLNRYLGGLFSCLIILSLFQNCGKNRFFESQQDGPTKDVDQKVENSEKNVYKSLIYDAQEAMPAGQSTPTTTRLEIDLDNKTVIYGQYSGFSSGLTNNSGAQLNNRQLCKLDDTRAQQLKDILTEVSICQPAPAPAGTMQCMAIAIPDIALKTADQTVELSAVICGTGTYLCGQKDGQLRALLIDIKNKKPANGSCSNL